MGDDDFEKAGRGALRATGLFIGHYGSKEGLIEAQMGRVSKTALVRGAWGMGDA
jgi:hypothetical protein